MSAYSQQISFHPVCRLTFCPVISPLPIYLGSKPTPDASISPEIQHVSIFADTGPQQCHHGTSRNGHCSRCVPSHVGCTACQSVYASAAAVAAADGGDGQPDN